ncbi:hypothetical protein GJ744_007106 [Endocarpon pusillum]|uniref:DUF6594 domain-containing protein n=1 Tax=Endocarpon pusillum TaxID=364733 RepID=A0A8H7A3Z7_9EURO|nr:hypothetical protein GJ744_007106 [Endocarpon pusillum]
MKYPNLNPNFSELDPDLSSQDPAKFFGYRVFSRWMASDQAWCILRRFGALNMRAMLYLQDDIVALEERLDRMDENLSSKHMPEGIDNGTFRKDYAPRQELIRKELIPKLKEYNDFVNQYSQLLSRPPVDEGDVEAVHTWFKNHRARVEDGSGQKTWSYAIDPAESAFIEKREDLIPVYPKTRSWFRTVLEKTALLRFPILGGFLQREPEDIGIIGDSQFNRKKGLLKNGLLDRFFQRKPQDIEHSGASQSNGKMVIWHNEKRVERFASTVIAVVGLAMLIGPLWILESLSDPPEKLGVITGFIVLFFVLVGVATAAKVFEALVAAAAYSAVLMVFLQFGQ